MRIICIIQARMGSTRLPQKIMQDIIGKPMLWWVVNRVQKSRFIDDVVVATTTQVHDKAVESLCKKEGWSVYRGDEHNVLDRYYQTLQQYPATHIVRITSDCPLIDPAIIDYIIASHLSVAPVPDYTSNIQSRTYPRGLDVEVMNTSVLQQAWSEATEDSHKEHVTPYIWQNPNIFVLNSVSNQVDYSNHRWTVDTPEDIKLVQSIYEEIGHGDFTWQDVIHLLEENPDWVEINAMIQQKKI